jgi:hypothetical protein
MRYSIPLAAGLLVLCAAGPAAAQHRLLEVMHWQFHGPVASIEEREYKFDYKTDAIATEPENTQTFHFNAQGRLEKIDATDPYGKTTYTLRYDDAGRLQALRRERFVEGRRKFGEEQACERNDKGEITSLTKAEFVGIVSIKLPRQVENEVEGNRRTIKTYKLKEDGGQADRLYLFENERLLAILQYDGFSDPERVSRAMRFDEKGVMQESRRFSYIDDVKEVSGIDNFKYEFDSQGNWTSRTRHTKFRDDPDKAMGRVTRVVKYREE